MENINKNIIMQAGAAVANATNKAAGLTAATPEPGSIISAIQLVNGGRTIGPDALAHFTESVRNKLLSLLVTMEPIQDFNGYGHPWPGGGGVNLFGGEYNQKFALFIAQGTIVTAYCDEVATINYYKADGTTRIDYWSIVGGASRTFTITEDAYYFKFGSAQGMPPTKMYIAKESAFSGFSPYSNICPITGRTGLDVYACPTSAIGDATTYSMDWTTPAGTVYAGSADVVSGDIEAAPYYASYNGETLVGPWISSMDVYDPEGTPTIGAQVVDLGGAMTEYHITGQDIITLVGDNYIWSDSGDVTITE